MNRRAVIVGVAGAVVLALLWFFLFWSPQGKRLDAAEERQATAEQTNGALQVTLDRLRDLESRRPELQGQLEALRRAVPDQPQLARFLLAAHEAATRSGVELNTVTPARPAPDAAATTATTAAPTAGGSTTTTTAAAGTTATTVAPTTAAPSAISLSLEVQGGYFQVLDFLNRIDDLPRIVVVDSLDLGAGEDTETGTGGANGTTADGRTELTTSITARMFTGSAPTGDAGAAGGATTATTAPTTATTATGTDS